MRSPQHCRGACTIAGRLLASVAIVAGTIAVVGPVITVLAAPPVPTTTVTSPTINPLLGEASAFTVTFDNTDTTASGYSPYIDIRINTAGADGAGAAIDDGLTLATMSFLGSSVPAVAPAGVLCTGANVTHPLTGLPVSCVAGQKLFVFQLPFGSFTPAQPIAVLDTTVTMSNLADVGVALSLSATPGFAFGNSPTGTTPILGSLVSATLTPQIARLKKTYQGPENETATGPNFPQGYVVTADLPNAMVFSSVRINDAIPDTHQFNAVTAVAPTAASSGNPSTTTPGGTLTRQWGPITGGATTVDASVSYSFFVPRLDRLGAPVMNATTGDDVNTVNDSSMVVTYTPTDTRDSVTTTTINPNTVDNHTLIAKSIAIQKSSTISDNVGSSGFNAGDTLTYTISGQVSDYFSDGGIDLTDVLGDGQTFVPGTATFTSTSEGVTTTGPAFDSADITLDESARTTCGNGTTSIVFHVSDALVRAGASGVVVGGLVHTTPNNAATFSVSFDAAVSDAYACSLTDLSIDEGDHIDNAVTVVAGLYDAIGVAIGTTEADDSSTTRPIETASVTKTIYAKNGVIGPVTTITAGDVVTYRLQTTSPSTDFEALSLTDFLPLPVFTASTFATGPVTTSCATPAVDAACYGPADTMHDNGAAPDPTVSIDTTSNSVRFDYGTYDDPANQPTAIDLLLSVRVTDAAFRDGLLFTNEVLKRYNNSFGDASTAANITQVTLTEPAVDIVKGVASTNNANIAGLSNATTRNPTGVTWFAPGSSAVSPGFTGTVTTAGLAADAPNANATGADAGDLVRFAIVVENTGTGGNGAFDVAIDDTFPVGFVVPAAGIRLLVTNGAGTALGNVATGAFVAPPGTGGAQAGTITLTDGASGSLAPGKTGTTVNTTGTNVAVVTYELEVAATAVPNTVYTNTTNLTGFSGSEGGPNFIADVVAAKKTNLATVKTATVVPVKTVLSSDQANTTGDRMDIGEVVTYKAVLTVPEGTTQVMNVVDTLDVGQAMVSVDSVVASAALSSTVGFPTALANAQAALAAPGSGFTLALGDVANSNRDNTTAETITVVYRAVILNVATNTISVTKNNVVTVSYAGNPAGSAAQAPVTIVEPVLVTDKSATPTTADANDTATFVVDVRHTNVLSDGDAFEVSTVDVIPSGLTYVPGSLQPVGGAAKDPTSLTTDGTTITATWATLVLAPFEFGQFTYQATLDPNTPALASVTNTATTTWTSVPGAGATTPFNTNDTERTGADGVGGLNDFVASDSATVTVADPQISKSLYSTDDVATTGNDLTIGETGTYQLLVSLPEATIPGFQVRDALPTGLRVVGTPTVITTVAASNGELVSDFDGTLGTRTFTTDTVGTTDTLVLDVGPSTVTSDNDVDNNSFLVRFDAIVADVAENVGIVPNTVLDNTATVQVSGGNLVTSNTVAIDIVEPQLDIVKSFSPNGAAPGSFVTVTITDQNAGLSDGFESILTDTLDSHFASATVVSTSVPTGWTFSRTGAVLTWTSNTGVAHAAGTTLTFVFTVQLLASNVSGATIPNSASATTTTRVGVAATERTEPASIGSAILGVVTPDLNVTKTDGATSVAPGATLDYVVVTSNTGGAIARNVTLTDTIPAGMTYVSVTGACVLNLASTASIKVFDLGSIANAASASCTIRVTVDNPAPAGTSGYVNSVTVADDGTNGTDPTPANNTRGDTDTLVANPDLSVTKNDGVTSRTPGSASSYVVTVTNTGNIGATNILVSDTLPDGFTFTGCTQDSGAFSTACTSSGGVVSTTATMIAGGGGFAVITISGTIVAPAPAGLDTVTNTVHVVDDGVNGVDPTTANNTATDVDTIDASPDLVISKSSPQSTVIPGGAVGYSLTATNAGTQNATGVVVTDPFPPGLTAVCGSESPTATTCSASGFTWTAATLAVGAFTTYTYTLHAANPMPAGTHTLTNTATVADDGTNGPDPTPANNTATVAIALVGFEVDLAVTKSDSVTATTPGSTLTYSIVVNNLGNIGASGVRVVDALPSGTTFVAAPDTGHGVGVNASGVVTWNIGVVPGGVPTTLTLVVSVDSPAAASREQLVNGVAVNDDGFSGADPNLGDNTASDTDVLTAAPDLVVTKSDGVGSTQPGSTLTYVVNIANIGNQSTTGIDLVDTLPSGATFVSASDAGTETLGVVHWVPFALAAGANRNFTVVVSVDTASAGSGSIVNVASATDHATSGADPTPSDNSATDADTLIATPDLTITKTDGVAAAAPGDTLTYSLTMSNEGDQDATGVTAVDTIPTGTTFSSASDAGSYAAGAVTWPLFVLPAGTDVIFTVVVTVDDPATAAQSTIVNSAHVADDGLNGADPTPADNTATDTDTLGASPDIVVTKSDTRTTVQTGQSLIYDITISNVGDQDATDVAVVDDLPGGVTFVGTTDSGFGPPTVVGQTMTWPLFDVAAGETVTATVTVSVDSAATAGTTDIVNTVSAFDDGTNGADPTPADNVATDTDTLDAAPDLVVTKTDGISDAAVGDVITYAITVTNDGTQDATGVIATDTLPDGVTLISSAPGGPVAGGVITWPAFDLAVGATAVFAVTVTVNAPAASGLDEVANTATAVDDGTNGADLDPNDNSSTDTDDLHAAPDLTITKTDGRTNASPGDVLTYTLVISNVGDQDATGVQIADAVPTGTSFVDAPSTVDVGAGVNVAGVIRWPDFDLDAGDSVVVTISVAVDAVAPGGLESVHNLAGVISDFDGADPTPSNNLAADVDDLIAVPDLVVTKTDGRTTVRPDSTVDYTITVTNVGNQDATGVTSSDTLPPGVQFISATGSGTLAGNLVSWPPTDLDAGDVITHVVSVKVAMPFTLPALELSNVANAFDDHTGGIDPTPSDNVAIDVDAVDNVADLAITNSNGTTRSSSGTYTTWQVTVTNHGHVPVSHFRITDVLPAQVSDVSYRTTSGTFDSASGVWSGPALDVGATMTISVTGLIDSAAIGTLTNLATVTVLDGFVDPTPGDNTATDIDDLVSPSGISITKTAAAPTAVLGSPMVYTVTISNAGPSVATQVSFEDDMPLSLRLQPALATEGWTCADTGPAAAAVSCDLDQSLLPGASETFLVHTDTLAVGNVRNVVTVTAYTTGNRLSSSAIADIQVSPPTVTPLPKTGADVQRLLLEALALIAGGALLLMAVRRRGPSGHLLF